MSVPPTSEAAAPIQEALDTLYHVGAGHKHWPPAELCRRSRHGSEALAALEARLAEAERALREIATDTEPNHYSRLQRIAWDALPPESETR